MKPESKEGSYDIFRDSPLRYLGYANEVGESFRYQAPKLVIPSYILAIGYCLGDAATTGYDTYTSSSSPSLALLDSADTLIWQGLASVMIPGATINIIVKATRIAVQSSLMKQISSPIVFKWLPTAMGLSSIPFIIHPIDRAVDVLLDNTTRPYMNDWKKNVK